MNFIEFIQRRLVAHGFDPGPIDGEDGPKTRAGIKAFEKAYNLKTDGMADPEVIELLRAEPTDEILEPNIITIPEKGIQKIDLVPNIWPRQKDVPKFYGAVGTNQTQIEVPFDMVLAWAKSTRIKKITLHKKVAESAERVFNQIANDYSKKEREDLGINLFGGSLNVRKMRGGSSWSMHSWGIAIDFDPERNQLQWSAERARLADPDAYLFWKAWEKEGWLSLGRARNYDWMHVQATRL